MNNKEVLSNMDVIKLSATTIVTTMQWVCFCMMNFRQIQRIHHSYSTCKRQEIIQDILVSDMLYFKYYQC